MATTRRTKVPDWITGHFEEYFESIKNLSRIISISERGISVFRGMPRVLKALANAKAVESAFNKSSQLDTSEVRASLKEGEMERAEAEAALAQREVETGFPVLRGLAVVAFWSWIENFAREFAVLWLVNRKDSYSSPSLGNVKVRLGEYLQLSPSDRAHYIVQALEQNTALPLKRGVTRLDCLFDAFGLASTPVPDGSSTTIFELQQVRNAVAHRNGRADRQLKLTCPWLKVKLGKPIPISHKMLGRYMDACMHYWLVRFYDVGDRYGVDLRPQDSEGPALH
jgi:hypothetical protein